MHLLVCLVTHNRLLYTTRTIEGFLSTVTVPYFLVVVDNASTDGTRAYLQKLHTDGKIGKLILSTENYFPGRACNIGWTKGLEVWPQANFLARLDNDLAFQIGWCEEARQCFAAFPTLGQIGLEHGALEPMTRRVKRREVVSQDGSCTVNPYPGNIGGPCIIRRELWDSGLRYSEAKWAHGKSRLPAIQEDVLLSEEVSAMGYDFGHMTKPLVRTFGGQENWSEFPDYYRETMARRGYQSSFPELYANGRGNPKRSHRLRRLAIRIAVAPFHAAQRIRIRRAAKLRVARRRASAPRKPLL